MASSGYIRTHAALRGIAAFLVVAYHFQFGASHRLPVESTTAFFNRCYLLVDLFFILSGFIISYTRDAGSLRVMSRGEARDFYVIRLARIYPLHVFCLCGALVATIGLWLVRRWHHAELGTTVVDAAAARSFIEEILLVQAWIPGAPRWNIPSWSISAELFAYLTFPLILLARHHLPRLTSCLLLMLPLAFYLVVMLRTGSLDIIAGAAPLRCLSGFMIGVLLCEYRQGVASWPNGVIAACQCLAVVAIVAVLATPCPDPVIIPFFALLVIVTWEDRGPLRAVLFHRTLIRSGELSYSVYLNHVGVIAVALPVWYAVMARVSGDADLARAVYISICLAVIVLVSRWTSIHIEERGRQFIRRSLLTRKHNSAAR